MSEGPGAGNAHTLETETLHVIDDFLSRLCTLPGRLSTESALVVQEIYACPRRNTLERVAEIPPGGHIVNHFHIRTLKTVLGLHVFNGKD